MKKLCIFTIALFIYSFNSLMAQFIEDALRLTSPNSFLSPRVAGLNVSYHGLSDDISALIFNPAGLSLIAKSEFSTGFAFDINSSKAEFLKNPTKLNSNSEYLTHIGMAVPFETSKGKASVGVAYFLESNYDNDYLYSAFNPSSTIIDYYAKNGPKSIKDNLATYLWLADTSNFKTPIKDSLLQKADIQEKGGMHNVTGGGGFDISENVSVGFSITGKWGNYKYIRQYSEKDILNKYNYFDEINWTNVDFDSLYLEESFKQKITGITGTVGLQARIGDFIRIGASIKFPTFYEVDEEFYKKAIAFFDNGEKTDPPYNKEGETSYKVRTPFQYSAGISFYALGLTFTAGVEYMDITQTEFSDAPAEIENLNLQIARELVGQTTWGFGVEYELPALPIVGRASFTSRTSPYTNDIPGASLKIFSLGGGIYLASNIRLDAVFRWSEISELRSNYGEVSRYTLKPNRLNLGLQLTYRY